jgi:hypothetical protein
MPLILYMRFGARGTADGHQLQLPKVHFKREKFLRALAAFPTVTGEPAQLPVF